MVSSMTPYGYPSEYYHCLLDEQPYYLAPSRLFGPDTDGPLYVNPQAWFSWHGALPPDKARRVIAAGYPLSKQLPPHAVWVLTRANILVDSWFVERHHGEWQETVWNCSKDFERG